MIDLASFSVAGTIMVGVSPQEIAVNPRRPEAYVVNTLGDTLSVVDTDNKSVKKTVDAGSKPWDVKV